MLCRHPAARDRLHHVHRSEADSSGQLMEITVTANKRAENMQDVPIAIEAVTSQQLAASGITQTSDSDGVRLGQ
jgi:outer membrane receptor protein involved in Fe transport